MTTPPLDEQIVNVLARTTFPQSIYELVRDLGLKTLGDFDAIRDAADRLTEQGLIVQPQTGGYSITPQGRARAADAIGAEMQDANDDTAQTLIASMAAMAPTAREFVSAYDGGSALDLRESLVASMNAMAPSTAFNGWNRTAGRALADHRAAPTLTTALRARRALRMAIAAYDPKVVVPGDYDHSALVASAAPRAHRLVDAYRAPVETLGVQPLARVASARRAVPQTPQQPPQNPYGLSDGGCCGLPMVGNGRPCRCSL
jgi:hypothetical protein